MGKTLKIQGKWTYSDLDELIVNHVKAMAKKVEEMMNDDRYLTGSHKQTGRLAFFPTNLCYLHCPTDEWLTTYTEANPKRAIYAFCINPRKPGCFHMCFKNGQQGPLNDVQVRVIPNAFELRNSVYPDMR